MFWSPQERGVPVLTKALEQCLAVRWEGGSEVVIDNQAPPISKKSSQDIIEILKTLFNIAHRFHKQEPDEVKIPPPPHTHTHKHNL